MSITLAIALLLLYWLCTTLSRYSLCTPYLAGAAAMTVCSFLKASPVFSVIAVILAYLIVFFLNEDVDASQLLAREEDESASELSALLGSWMKIAKVVVFSLLFFLPVPKPPGYLITIVATALIIILLWANRDKNKRGTLIGYLILSGMSMGICAVTLIALKTFWLLDTPVVPLLAGLAIPSLVSSTRSNRSSEQSNRTLAEAGMNTPPGINQILFSIGLCWLTPGLSLSAATGAIVAPGVYRVVVATLGSVAIEAWNLSLLIRGGGPSNKTPLADLLLRSDRQYHSPLLDGYGLGYEQLIFFFLIAVLPAIALYWTSTTRVEPDSTAVLFVMVVQSFAASGLTALVLIPLGLGVALLQQFLMPDHPEVRSLVIMSPMWIN